VHGSQEAARRAEGNWTDSKAIHNIDETEAHQQYKHKRDKATSADQPKPMLLCEDIAEDLNCYDLNCLMNKKELC
jgi:hypothetical protein